VKENFTSTFIKGGSVGALPLECEVVTALTGTLACDHAHHFVNPIR
jgi:hypothetical protein